MEMVSTKPQLRVLLDHLGTIKDTRQPWKVAYPLREVLFLVVCGTIACGDDWASVSRFKGRKPVFNRSDRLNGSAIRWS